MGESIEGKSGARPLMGRCVMVARPRHDAEPIRQKIEAIGAEVIVQPAIEIGPPPDWAAVDGAIGQLAEYDWVVFSSANGVRALLDRILANGGDLRCLGGAKLAAIGPGTAEALTRYHLRADLVPGEYRAEALAKALIDREPGRAGIECRANFLLIRASRGREVLADMLEMAGAVVDQVVAYTSRDVLEPEPEAIAAMAAGRIDWVLVTSSSIAVSLVKMFGKSLERTRLVSISPITTAALADLGFHPALEADEYTLDGMLAAILAAQPCPPAIESEP